MYPYDGVILVIKCQARFGSYLKSIVIKFSMQSSSLSTCSEIVMWMPHKLINEESTLIQSRPWCREALVWCHPIAMVSQIRGDPTSCLTTCSAKTTPRIQITEPLWGESTVTGDYPHTHTFHIRKGVPMSWRLSVTFVNMSILIFQYLSTILPYMHFGLVLLFAEYFALTKYSCIVIFPI